MFEKAIDFIGRILSFIFRKSNDFIDNTKTEYGMVKQQAKIVKVNTQSTLSVSVSGENHVNYFRNRVVGEFLRLMSSIVAYKFEPSSGKYVVYFVRHRRKMVMEYIKFSKNNIEDTDADISYTFINKIISSTGVTTNIGRTDRKVLVVDDSISNCIYDAISGKKAPLYLVHILDNKIGVGNPTFVYDCWITTVKLISKKVKSYLNDPSNKDGQMIDTLMYQAGIHMFMSYFRSLDNPFYRTMYKKSNTNSIVEAVKEYNSRHFNTNKILNFSFDYSNKGSIRVENDSEKQYSILSLYGISIKFSGMIKEVGEHATSRFNYKLAESLLKSEDANLKFNFLFYMFSTGGIDDSDIIRLAEEEEFEISKTTDLVIANMNNNIEPVISEVMKNSNFSETEEGDLVSRDFTEFINQEVKLKSNSEEISIPVVTDYSITYSDNRKEDTSRNSIIESLRAESNKEESRQLNNSSNNSSKVDSDAIRNLKVAATGNSNIIREEEGSSQLQSSVSKEDKNITDILNTPLTKWTSQECMKVLGSEDQLSGNITRADILDRMMFLSSKSEGK